MMFLIGVFAGTILGVLIIAVLSAGGDDDDRRW